MALGKSVLRESDVNSGRFIVLDGPDGAGKSTQLRLLAETLRKRGIAVLTPREPGGTKVGEAIRRILLTRRKTGMTALTEAFLFQAARAQLVADVIRPALRKGVWVLCDRFALSTVVYQGRAGGVALPVIRSLIAAACGTVKPDLYVILDVKPEEALRRRKAEGRSADRMEAKGRAFAAAVRRGFLAEAELGREGRRLAVVSGTGDKQTVRDAIWRAVAPLARHRRGACEKGRSA
jgi:dTMP kinase